MAGLKRLGKELAALNTTPVPNISVTPRPDDIQTWDVGLGGPSGTPYEGGNFDLELKFPAEYPFKPPAVLFKTKVYHCNVNDGGNICMEMLGTGWSPALQISKVLASISSLLASPNPADPLVAEIAGLYEKDRAKHDANAKEWTKRYAKAK